MTAYKFGDIVLVFFIQPNGERKKRPAMVILDIGDDDVILAPITTAERNGRGNYRIKEWQKSSLLKESWLRLAKVSCLEKMNIDRTLGKVSDKDKRRAAVLWAKLYRF
jgi:mRNA interferase MazF